MAHYNRTAAELIAAAREDAFIRGSIQDIARGSQQPWALAEALLGDAGVAHDDEDYIADFLVGAAVVDLFNSMDWQLIASQLGLTQEDGQPFTSRGE